MSTARGADDRHRSSMERLVAAAVSVLAEDTRGVIMRGLDRKRVATRAAMSRTVVHRLVPTPEDLLTVVAGAVLGPEPVEEYFDQVAGWIDDRNAVLSSTGGPFAAIRAVSREHFEQLAADPAYPLIVLFCAVVRDQPELRAVAQATYGRAEEEYAAAFQELLRPTGAEPLPSLTFEAVSRAATAVVEGFALRRLVDDSVTPDEVADVLELLLGSMLYQREPMTPTDRGAARDTLSMQEILGAASTVAGRMGASTTIRMVEDELGVEHGALDAIVGDRDGLVDSFWNEFATTTFALQLQRHRDGDDDLSPIRRALAALTEHALAHPGMVRMHLMCWLDTGVSPIRRQARDPLARVLQRHLLQTANAPLPAEARRIALNAIHALFMHVVREPPPSDRMHRRTVDAWVESAFSPVRAALRP